MKLGEIVCYRYCSLDVLERAEHAALSDSKIDKTGVAEVCERVPLRGCDRCRLSGLERVVRHCDRGDDVML